MQSYLTSLLNTFPTAVPNRDWDRIIRVAASEQILPAIRSLVAPYTAPSSIPAEAREAITAAESLNSQRNQYLIAEALHVAALTNQIDIEPIALKGLAYLLVGVYPDPAARYLGDLDFLIPTSRLSEATAHLLSNGFHEDEATVLMELRHHQPNIRRPNGPFVELHHSLGIGICNRLLPAKQIIAESTPITLQGATLRLPSPTHLAVHLILHSQLAHPYHDRVFPPLRALYDLLQLQTNLGSQIDWPRVDSLFRRVGQSATLHLHLAQAHEILGLTPPIPLQLGPLRKLRLARRRLLNRHPKLRFLDPTYLFLSFFSRRARLIPGLVRNPHLWPQVLKRLISLDFYISA